MQTGLGQKPRAAPTALRLWSLATARSLCFAALSALCFAKSAAASTIGDYFRGYEPGVSANYEYTASNLSYIAPTTATLPGGCHNDAKNSGNMRCTATLDKPTSLGWSVFLQQAFKRKGLFYLGYDLGISVFSLDGRQQDPPAGAQLPPLKEARIHLYGVDPKIYLQTGLTPNYFPDVLLALGVGAQMAAGNLEIDGQRQRLWQSIPLGYTELEIVWARFGRGAVSTYVSLEAAGLVSPVFHGTIDGMSQFQVAQGDYTLGVVKLVLPVP